MATQSVPTLPNRVLEVVRIVGAISGFAVASSLDDPAARLRVLQLFLVVSIAGITAFEGLVLPAGAAQVSGYGEGGPYQRQSALNNLACALVSTGVFLLGWGSEANAAVLLVLLVFLVLSGMNHALSAFHQQHRTLRSVSRPFMSLALAVACVPFLHAAL